MDFGSSPQPLEDIEAAGRCFSKNRDIMLAWLFTDRAADDPKSTRFKAAYDDVNAAVEFRVRKIRFIEDVHGSNRVTGNRGWIEDRMLPDSEP